MGWRPKAWDAGCLGTITEKERDLVELGADAMLVARQKLEEEVLSRYIPNEVYYKISMEKVCEELGLDFTEIAR